ncbi:MAG: ATP:cob(I)alamin adenosyltransferase, partial [Chloroflexi bacterium]|nr:ATP:cob(I)alamin adenosyltransferase [Chloroflexota bacterium]
RLRDLRQAQGTALESARIDWLEAQTLAVSALVPVPDEFILPGDSPAGAAMSLARTVVRRAERRVAELLDRKDVENPLLLQYLNRLSSLCFALELLENQAIGKKTRRARGTER